MLLVAAGFGKQHGREVRQVLMTKLLMRVIVFLLRLRALTIKLLSSSAHLLLKYILRILASHFLAQSEILILFEADDRWN